MIRSTTLYFQHMPELETPVILFLRRALFLSVCRPCRLVFGPVPVSKIRMDIAPEQYEELRDVYAVDERHEVYVPRPDSRQFISEYSVCQEFNED